MRSHKVRMNLILLLVGATAAGWWLGGRPSLGHRAQRMGRPVMLVALGLLLFGMGLSLGSHPGLVSEIGTLGLRAVTISWSGALGAVLAVLIVRRIRHRGRRS